MKNILLILTLTLTDCQANTMNNDSFNKTITDIANSDLYQSVGDCEGDGLNSSDDKIIHIMTEATYDFLNKIEKVHYSNANHYDKKQQIEIIVDELPWDSLDTKEKEYLADTLAPAIQVAGFNPWDIF